MIRYFDFTIRYSQEEYLKLFSLGGLRLNHANKFVEDCLGALVHDPHECSIESYGHGELAMYDNKNKSYKPIANGIITKDKYNCFIFCFTNISKGDFEYGQNYQLNQIVDHNATELRYEKFVVITDKNELVNRIVKTLKDIGFKVDHGPVDYIDLSSYTGALTPFKKDLKYKSQHEYRIVAHNTLNITDKYIDINIGDISDITSEILSVNDDFIFYLN